MMATASLGSRDLISFRKVLAVADNGKEFGVIVMYQDLWGEPVRRRPGRQAADRMGRQQTRLGIHGNSTPGTCRTGFATISAFPPGHQLWGSSPFRVWQGCAEGDDMPATHDGAPADPEKSNGRPANLAHPSPVTAAPLRTLADVQDGQSKREPSRRDQSSTYT